MRLEPVTNACSSAPDPCCEPVRVAGTSQFRKASWYDQVGSPTASGESLDTFSATAAHRSLPLTSYAKVTNLDNHRSVIVKIHDLSLFRNKPSSLSKRARSPTTANVDHWLNPGSLNKRLLLDAVRCRGSRCCGSGDRCYIPSSGNSDRMSGKMWSGGGTLGCRSMLRRLIQHTVRPSGLPPTMSVNCD